jgi:hypothetical protein
VYANLEFLGLDADFGLAVDALVRGGPDGPRTLVFHGRRPSVEVEIDETGILGHLSPPQPGQVRW